MIRLLPPICTLLLSLALLKLGIDVWSYRQIPAKWIVDPTSFNVAAKISAAILIPAALGVLLSCIALIQRMISRTGKP